MPESLFKIKLQAQTCSFIKKETLAQVFPVNFAKFLRTLFFNYVYLAWLNAPDGKFSNFFTADLFQTKFFV